MTFRDDQVEQFIELFQSRYDQIRAFDGCSYLELIQDIDRNNIFFTVSYWDSADSLELYRKSGLFRDTWSRTKQLFAGRAEAWSTQSLFELK